MLEPEKLFSDSTLLLLVCLGDLDKGPASTFHHVSRSGT